MIGAIIINKPSGLTSRDVINELNKILNIKSVGHTGTLDPIATGVLVCLIGKATKLSDILVHDTKEYIASFKLGIETDTLDITGNILKENNLIISKDKLIEAINNFPKEYEQEVPAFSAIKIDGKKLYEYARNNEKISLPKRKVNIYNLTLLEYKDNIVKIKTSVSKGTYIRSLIRDIAANLNTYGTMLTLERTKLGQFTIKDSCSLEDVKNNNYHLYSLEELLNIQIINLNDQDYKLIKNGNIYPYKTDKYILFKYQGEDVALYQKQNEEYLKPLIMF
jgi:tRNA pseudouridine55 synthase